MIPRLQRMFVPGAVVLSIVASVAMAQIPLVFLRGTIESASSDTLAVKLRDGRMTNLKLADDVHVFTLKQSSLADLKRGSLVGTTAMRQMDGSQKAVEIYVFPEELRHEPNVTANTVVGRENEILSYTEGSVLDNEANVLTIKYTYGENKITIPANVRIVMLVPATVADIKAGQYFLVPNGKPESLGTLASTIIVGSNSIDFAM
jgi:hypothetical protein